MDKDQRLKKLEELESLRRKVAQLEREAQGEAGRQAAAWQASGYYAAYHATTGFLLGIFGAAASLLFNVIGSLAIGQQPLRLIQIYLTFPLGEKALTPQFDTGIAMAIGCCLYLATGMALGVPFQLIMARFFPEARGNLGSRLLLATLLGLLLWIVNFFGILSWLQPLLFGGNWIVSEIPMWVAALTHLVFAWTMALVYPWGAYVPYQRQTDQLSTGN